jgi:MORN repeat
VYENGDAYKGQFNEKKQKHGIGTILFANGILYEGEWKNDIIDGYGMMVHPSGKIFNGEWKNGIRDGYGETEAKTETTKIISSGLYKNNNFYNGLLTITHNDFKLKGSFVNGKKSLFVTIIFTNGDIFEGKVTYLNIFNKEDIFLFEEGNKKYANGNTFKGSFKNNYNYDFGTLTFQNGDVERGFWENNKQNGQCEKIINNGKHTIIGTFIHGVANGWCKEIFIDEIDFDIFNYTYEGQMKNNQKHGFGNLKYDDGKSNKCLFKDNSLLHTFYDDIERNSCDVCFDDFHPSKLFPSCADNKCDKVMCVDCISSYYDKIKKGAVMDDKYFSCIYCRKLRNINVLSYIMDDLFTLLYAKGIKDHNFAKSILSPIKNRNNLLGWCIVCNDLYLVKKEGCDIQNNELEYKCKKCAISEIKIKQCPHCGVNTARSDSRNDGCHHITCRHCWKYWCWFCLVPLEREHQWKCAINGCNNP